MRAREQHLDRASHSHDSNRAAPQTVITVGTPPPAERPQGGSARAPPAEVDGALDTSRPDMLAAPPAAQLGLVKAGWRPPMQPAPAERVGYAVPPEAPVPATGIS